MRSCSTDLSPSRFCGLSSRPPTAPRHSCAKHKSSPASNTPTSSSFIRWGKARACSTTSWSWSRDRRWNSASPPARFQRPRWSGSASTCLTASRPCTGWESSTGTSNPPTSSPCRIARCWPTSGSRGRPQTKKTTGTVARARRTTWHPSRWRETRSPREPTSTRWVSCCTRRCQGVDGDSMLRATTSTGAGFPWVLPECYNAPSPSRRRIAGPTPPRSARLWSGRLRRASRDPLRWSRAEGSSSLSIQAGIAVAGQDVRLRLTGSVPASEYHVPLERWQTLSDSLAYQIVLGVWADRSPLAASLPVPALPHTYEGLVRFLKAEQLVAEAQWELAYQAYSDAEKTDPTCWICSWRINEIGRWLSRAPNPDRVRRVRLHADSLPPRYRSIIHAAQLPVQPRLDTLRAAAEQARELFLGWFQLGDELFHRGPLVGHRRAEAIAPLERASRLRPDFGPAWEHLAWVATAEGD